MKTREKMKYIFLGATIAVIFTTTIVPAFAAQIEALFNTVNITIDGKQTVKIGDEYKLATGELVPYSISYKGTTYLPMRKLGELLGFEIDWNNNSKTVYVTSPDAVTTPVPTPTPTPTPTPVPADNYDEFEVITGEKAQKMYDNREEFVVVLYDSKRLNAESYLDEIKKVAKSNKIKLYVVDGAKETSETFEPAFAKVATNSYSNLVYPIVYYVFGYNNIKYNVIPTNTQKLKTEFEYFKENYTPSTAGKGAYEITLNRYMVPITYKELNNKMDISNEKFVLIYYNSTDANSYYFMTNFVYDAVLDAARTVYVLDAAAIIDEKNNTRLKDDKNFWPNNYNIVNDPYYGYFPLIYFVKNGNYSQNGFDMIREPRNKNVLANTIRDFLKD